MQSLLRTRRRTYYWERGLGSRISRVSGFVGFVTPFFTIACIIAATVSWNEFSWTNNALSDLGVQSGVTALVFNGGLVISGLLYIVFAAGLYHYSGLHFLGRAGTLILVWACFSLVAIGVFNEHFRPTHYIVSVSFFVSLPISMLVLVAAFWILGKRSLSVFTLCTGLAAAIPWILQFTFRYVQNVAIPEFVSGMAGFAWVIVVSYLMLKKNR